MSKATPLLFGIAAALSSGGGYGERSTGPTKKVNGLSRKKWQRRKNRLRAARESRRRNR